ncbi:tetracenomycin polyketide synthesis protein [Chitinispirillum alkaliphilum]|nr:tetracenomycin polyketide synthesis protein [Chitinispirillum alkaliphilum]
MDHVYVRAEEQFKVLAGSERSQAAIMVVKAGQTTGSLDNMHLSSDQWLYVMQGSGKAVVEGIDIELKPGMLLLIEAGEVHEIFASEEENLETLNIYAPPEYPLD